MNPADKNNWLASIRAATTPEALTAVLTHLARLFCPEIIMGMQTAEEVEDVTAQEPTVTIHPRDLPESTTDRCKAILAQQQAALAPLTEVLPDNAPPPVNEDAEPFDPVTGEVLPTQPAQQELATPPEKKVLVNDQTKSRKPRRKGPCTAEQIAAVNAAATERGLSKNVISSQIMLVTGNEPCEVANLNAEEADQLLERVNKFPVAK